MPVTQCRVLTENTNIQKYRKYRITNTKLVEGRHSSNCQSTSTLAENIFGAAFLVVSKYLPVTQLLATCLPSSSELKYLRLPAFEIERHVAIEVQFGARKRADGMIG